jgi:nicotinamidase-related amidase
MYTLLCIDLQPRFNIHHHSRVVNNVEREIRQAIQDDAYIVLVEYQGCGPTVDQLANVAKLHSKVYRVEKSSDDGSIEVMEAIKKHGLPQQLKVCGVNTNVCVYFTIYSIRKNLPDASIEVVADACDSQWGTDKHLYGLDRLKDIGCIITRNKQKLS